MTCDSLLLHQALSIADLQDAQHRLDAFQNQVTHSRQHKAPALGPSHSSRKSTLTALHKGPLPPSCSRNTVLYPGAGPPPTTPHLCLHSFGVGSSAPCGRVLSVARASSCLRL